MSNTCIPQDETNDRNIARHTCMSQDETNNRYIARHTYIPQDEINNRYIARHACLQMKQRPTSLITSRLFQILHRPQPHLTLPSIFFDLPRDCVAKRSKRPPRTGKLDAGAMRKKRIILIGPFLSNSQPRVSLRATSKLGGRRRAVASF